MRPAPEPPCHGVPMYNLKRQRAIALFEVEDLDVARRSYTANVSRPVFRIDRFDERHLDTKRKPPVERAALGACKVTEREAFVIQTDGSQIVVLVKLLR